MYTTYIYVYVLRFLEPRRFTDEKVTTRPRVSRVSKFAHYREK